MSKIERTLDEVKTYLVTEVKDGITYTYLVIEKADGTRFSVNIFSGGGYADQLTFDEISKPSEENK